MPPRRQPPAPQAESKTGLVVSLIFFILTTLAFGVVAYLFYDEGKQADKKAQEAQKGAADAKNAADEADVARIIYAMYLGAATPKDVEKLVNLQKHPNYAAVLGTINAKYVPLGVTWDPATAKPVQTTEDRIKKLLEDYTAAELRVKAELAAKASQQATFVTNVDAEISGKNAAIAAQKKAQGEELAAKEAKAKELLTAVQTITEVREQFNTLKKTLENKEIDANKRIAALVKAIEEKDIKIKKIQEELEAKRQDILVTDKVHGKITQVDNANGIVWINIGSADFVRPQLTFSVAAPASAVSTSGRRERKGALEVTKVISEHLSQGKLIDVTNATQDPILVGDEIINPAWDPARPVRIALCGHIDFNGDGYDDTPELVRNLAKQGVQVDAWLDLKEIKINGAGVAGSTDYLVMGESPQSEFELGGITVGNREERKKLIRDKMDEMKRSAMEKGVEIIRYRRFLERIGYPVPKITVTPEFNPPGTLRQKLPSDAKTDDKKDEGK